MKKTDDTKAVVPADADLVLHEYTEEAYLKYAIASVKDRALAQVQDGQKPVQKRILYSMLALGLRPGAKPVKSARVVGDVIGKLHPHGDSAVYDAMVRMAQDFTLRHPVIAGQGNFGSRDGDSAAAYRYCFVGETRVSTEHGLIRIDELPWLTQTPGHASPPKSILTERCELPVHVQVTTRGAPRPALFWVNSGWQDTVRVRTHRDYSVRCTPNEPFLVLGPRLQLGWKDARELRPGDLLCLPRRSSLNVAGGAPFVAGFVPGPRSAELAGVLSGYTQRTPQGYAVVVNLEQSAAYIARLAKEVLGSEIITDIEAHGAQYRVVLHGPAVTRFIEALSADGEPLQARALPEAVYRGSALEVARFCHGLVLSTSGHYRRVGIQYMEFLLGTREAADALKLILLSRLGVISGRAHTTSTGGFNVHVAGRANLARFLRQLQPRAVAAPVTAGQASTPEAARSSNQAAGVWPSCGAEAAQGDYFFEPVRAVEPAEPAWVYDLTVPKTHAFVANGFMVHNTECRLAAFSDVLLAELERGTVDFRPNFDNTFEEPVVLPARLPVLALNGSMGIAVGMACDIPPHNLRETVAACIQLVRSPTTSDAEVLKLIPGPDFPDGGQIISSPEEIQSAYTSGRGVLRMRARWQKEELARGQWQIAVQELPYQVSTKRVLEQIEALCNPQAAKGKSIGQSQTYLKTAALSMLEKATDESGKDAAIRLVLAPRTAKTDPEELMAFLFANTDLESSVSVNLTFIGLDGSPQTRGLPEMLRQWCTFRTDTVRRRVTFELDQVRQRIHVLEGRMVVILQVDEVIKVIRDSEDPRAALIERFGLSQIQAEDILEMRLRQLARLEGIRIEKELKAAREEAARLERFLNSEPALRALIIQELEADAKAHGSDRRTVLKAERRAESQAAVTKAAVDEPLTILISQNLWVRARPGHELDPATLTWKTGDGPLAIVRGRTSQPVVMLDSRGRAYSIDASQIPTGRGDGVPLTTMIELQDGAKLLHVLAGTQSDEYVFAGERGYGFRAPLSALVARPRAGKAFLTLESDEQPLKPVQVEHAEGYLATGSSDGRLLVFSITEVKALDKGKGVMLMALKDDARLRAIHCGAGEPMELPLEGKTAKVTLKGDTWAKYFMKRARRGCELPKKGTLAR